MNKLKNIGIAISCLSPVSIPFVKYCIKHDIHYIDISPSCENIAQIKEYKSSFPNSKSTLVFGVGLAPGISNLMVKKEILHFDSVSNVEISLLLGLGENHGNDGIKWLLDNLNRRIKYANKEIKTFSKKKYIIFPEPLGKKSTYLFNNADQYILSKTLDLKETSSRFAYDSSFVTNYIALLQLLSIFKLLKIKFIKRLTIFLGSTGNLVESSHKI